MAAKLSIPAESLVMPNTPASTTNAITSTGSPADDLVVYEGFSAENNTACQSIVDAGCDQFTLTYMSESAGEPEIVESRRSARIESIKPDLEVSLSGPSTIQATWTSVVGVTSYELQRSTSSDLSSPITSTHDTTSASATDLPPNTEFFFRVRGVQATSFSEWSDVQSVSTGGFPAPTGTVTIGASMSGANARGTAGGGTCSSGTTERQIRYQVNAGTWQTWTTTSVRDVAATQGHIYNFQARARCTDGVNSGSWINSAYSAITAPVSGPSGLTITAAMSGSNAVGTAGGGTCATGTTMERQIRYNTNAGSYVAYITGATRSVAATSGYRYTFQQQARCVGLHVSSGYVASGTAYIDRPVAAPTGLTITAAMSGANAVGTAGGGTCATGTTMERQIRYAPSSTSAVGTYVGYTTGTPRSIAANQGWRYTFQQQARCMGAYLSSGWVASGTASTVRGITTVPAVPVVSSSISGDNVRFSWNAVACPTGTSAQYNGSETANHSPTSSAWGPSSAVLRDRFSYDGHTYTMRVQARCTSTHATGSYSGWSNTASRLRPVSPPVGNPSNFSHTYYSSSNSSTLSCYGTSPGSRLCRMFKWTQPTCRANAVPAYNWNSYMANFAWAGTGSAGWRYSPSTAWSDYLEYDEQGWFWSPSVNPYPSSGMNAIIRLRYLCSNRATGQMSGYGTTVQSPGFN